MTSMRRLRRRLLRWHQYARKTYWSPRYTWPAWQGGHRVSIARGHRRAWDALQAALDRREAERRWPGGRCVCGGCIGMGPCDDDLGQTDDDGCCALGAYGHDGPCEWICDTCGGTGRCYECGGDGEDGSGLPGTCIECGGGGQCPGGCYEGREVDDEWMPPYRPVETIAVAGGVL